jgi:hypothetical protein
MIKKARLSALVGLLAFLFLTSSCLADGCSSSGVCRYTMYSIGAVNQRSDYSSWIFSTWTNCNWDVKPPSSNNTIYYYGHTFTLNTYEWNSTQMKWNSIHSGSYFVQDRHQADFIAAIVAHGGGLLNPTTAYPSGLPNCGVNVCDAGDSDGDGVCNSCDKVPSAPDSKDCVYLTSRNAAGQVVDMMIDEGCKGSAGDNIASYRNEEAASQGDGRLYYDLTAHDREIDSRTCNASTGADADGNCACAYPPTNTKLSGFTDASGGAAVLTDAAESEYQAAKNLDDDDRLDDCAAVKNRCEAACSTRGGVVTNVCSSESGNLKSSCTCANNELAYDLDNESSDDSENSSADSDGDGVPDSIDKDSTGGPDSNNDNVDDTAAAIKGAIASLGLGGKLDAVNGNLNSIGNSVSGLGSKINGVTSAVSGLGSKIDGVGSSVDGLGSKLDGLGDKLDGISDKLDDGLEATGSADLPGTNEYNTDVENPEEQSFVDTVHNFLNSSLPVLSSISGSGLTASGSPSMSTELWGKTITLDFADWQGVLRAAGLVLIAVATILAFIIIL